MKVKFNTPYNYEENIGETRYEKIDRKSDTVPDMSMSVQTILERASAGEGFFGRNGEIPQLTENEDVMLNAQVLPRDADPVEIAAFAAHVENKRGEFEELLRKSKERPPEATKIDENAQDTAAN